MDDGWLRRALATKRDGGALDGATWARIVAEYTAGTIDDAPVAALAMACAIRGMDDDETVALTDAMVHSGETLHFSGNVVDKHSTGGVGDTVSLVAVPLVAACGVPVAKLSGRALGHTGGTLDKLEAIPGVRTALSTEELRAQVARVGCAIAGQSAQLVPADKKLYALRDRTATVPCIGLIAASIVSKKIAGGAQGIVFDVKAGRGAFLARREEAFALADALVRLARRAGRRASALVTDMDQPLGGAVGAGIEAIEARDVLRGRSVDTRLVDVAKRVAVEMLAAGGVDRVAAPALVDDALASGAAYATFVAMIEAQGGTRAALEAMTPAAPSTPVRAPHAGFLTEIDVVALGEAARDAVAAAGPNAGVLLRARVGDRVAAGDVLAELAGAPELEPRVRATLHVAERAAAAQPLVEAVVRDGDGAPSNAPGR